MSYTVLARRYRSRDFDEIVGQEAIARTLRSAIEQDRIAHAYLFCGTRGVGKTSMARIFAKALNAAPDLAEAEKIGEAIMRGEDLDVIEIDGASNRGIQEARDLIAGAGLSPSRCPYKIYIIDEVHMLTIPAFNALLKTMEEPPSHVKFILATTDPHKVPATIQSRCQRFDFRSLTTEEVATQLRYILDNEKITADEDVIHQVARLGNGSMRDALSMLDRLLATGESALTTALLRDTLGLPDHALMMQLIDSIVDAQPAVALETIRSLAANGATPDQLLNMMAEYFRDLMVMRTCGPETDLVDLIGDDRAIAARQAEQFDVPALVHLIAMADAVGRNARNATTGRALLDAAVVRMCMSEHFASVTQMLEGGGSSAGVAREKKKSERPLTSKTPTSARSASPKPPAARPAEIEPPVARVTEVKPDAPETPTVPAPSLDDLASSTWDQLIGAASLTPSQQAKLARVTFVELHRGGARPMFRFQAAGGGAAVPRESIQDIVRAIFPGTDAVVEIAAAGEDAMPETPMIDAPSEVRDDPLIREAMDLFDASIINVENDD